MKRRLFWKLVGAPLSRGSWTFTVESNFGFKMHANTVDLLGRYVYYFGVWEPNLTTWISNQLSEGDTFVDVGANLGYYTLLASRILGPSGTVVSIEASPRIIPRLMRNVALNHASNVRVVNVAVTNSEDEIEIYDGPIGNSGQTSVVKQSGLRRAGTVPSKPLPLILTDQELTRARLFKIDVEGAEWLVVEGLGDALLRTRSEAEFVIEISPCRLARLGRKPGDVLEVFQSGGFNAYSVVNHYSSRYYLERHVYEAPKRVRSEIVEETDIIFSRRDEAFL